MKQITLDVPDDVVGRLEELMGLYGSAEKEGLNWAPHSGLIGPIKAPASLEVLCVDLLDDIVDVQTEFVEEHVLRG